MARAPEHIYVLPAIEAISKRPVSSRFFENISPVTPISGPSGQHLVSPVSIVSPLRQEVELEIPIPREPRRSRSSPQYRTASSTGFTAPYVVGFGDEQYRFEKPQARKKIIALPRWRISRSTINNQGRALIETGGIVISAICLVVVIVVLHKYNGGLLSEWPHAITPNSFLAIFTTLMEAGIILSIATTLLRAQNLSNEDDRESLLEQPGFEVSKGPAWMRKKGFLGSIGIVLSVLTLTVSPTTQQMLSFPSRSALVDSTLSSAPKSNTFSSYKPVDGTIGLPDMKMQQAIKLAIFTPANDSTTVISPTCPSGDCTFSSFSSLAICSKVANVSSQLSITPLNGNMSTSSAQYNVTLPNGAYLLSGQMSMNMGSPLALVNGTGVSIANHTLAFADEPDLTFTAISDYFIIYNSPSSIDKTKFEAFEVLTYWCIISYNISVKNGVPTTVVTNVGSTVLSETAEVVNGTSTSYGQMVLAAGNETFTVNGRANQVLAEYMAATFTGYFEDSGSGGESWSGDAVMAADGVLEEDDQLLGIGTFAENVAVGMTNVIRSSDPNSAMRGTMYESLPHIHVSWAWISVLILLLVLACALLFATSLNSRSSRVGTLDSRDGVFDRPAGAVRIDETYGNVVTVNGRDGGEGAGESSRMVSRVGRGHERVWSNVSGVSVI